MTDRQADACLVILLLSCLSLGYGIGRLHEADRCADAARITEANRVAGR